MVVVEIVLAMGGGLVGLVSLSLVGGAISDLMRDGGQDGLLGVVWSVLWLVTTVAATIFFLCASATAVASLLGDEGLQRMASAAIGWSVVVGFGSFFGCLVLVRRLPSRSVATEAGQQAHAADERRSGARG